MSPLYEKIYQLVAKIPRGKVSTYGRVARAAGNYRYARQVGYALAALPPDSEIPWHRVVNTQGAISPRSAKDFAQQQRQRLLEEGVVIDRRGRIDLTRFLFIIDNRPRARSGSGYSIRPARKAIKG